MMGIKQPDCNFAIFLAVVLGAVGCLSTSYGLAVVSVAAAQPSFHQYFDLPEYGEEGSARTALTLALLNGVNMAGAVLGCILIALMTNKYGHKLVMMAASVVGLIATVLGACSVSIEMLAVVRFIAGVSAGIMATLVPIYLGEIALASIRGALMSIDGLMYALGYTVAGWVGYATFYIPLTNRFSSLAWRLCLALQGLAPIIVILGSPWIPSSPGWLLSKGRGVEALEVLQGLRASKRDPNNLVVKAEFDGIAKQYDEDRFKSPHHPFEIFLTPSNRKRALASGLLMAGGQLLGIYVIANYGILIYENLSFLKSTALLMNACWTTMTIIGNGITALIVDRVGRRRLMLAGTIGCLVSLCFIAPLTARYQDTDNRAGLNAIVVFIWLFTCFWCVCMDATQFVYACEIWPNCLRAEGTAWGLACFFGAATITLVAAPIALDAIRWKFYLILIISSLPLPFIIYFMCPETKGLTLEETGKLFGDQDVVVDSSEMSEGDTANLPSGSMTIAPSEHLSDGSSIKISEHDERPSEGPSNTVPEDGTPMSAG